MTHLAETEGEREFLEKGGGAFLDLLRKLGIVNASLPKPGCGPVELAGELGLLEDDCILAHVNYIDDAELDILAAGRASVAYCPRSSRFFGRSGHRYAQMLRRGVNVAVGTDSLASNWSLDMLAELRAIYAQGQLDCQRILEMGTINAAKALGLSGCIGTLERGKQADFVVVEVGAAEDPLAALLEGEGGVERTVIAGQTVFRKSR